MRGFSKDSSHSFSVQITVKKSRGQCTSASSLLGAISSTYQSPPKQEAKWRQNILTQKAEQFGHPSRRRFCMHEVAVRFLSPCDSYIYLSCKATGHLPHFPTAIMADFSAVNPRHHETFVYYLQS